MKITRYQSRVVALILMASFFALGYIFVQNQGPKKTNTPVKEAQPEATPAPPGPNQEDSHFTLNDFHRSETKNGKLVWEIKASQGNYFPANNSAKLKEATIWLYKKDGDVIQLIATDAQVFLQGQTLVKAEGSNGVTIISKNDLQLKTESATYSKQDETIFAPGFVQITSPQFDMSGDVLRGNVATKEFHLERNIQSMIRPKSDAHAK